MDIRKRLFQYLAVLPAALAMAGAAGTANARTYDVGFFGPLSGPVAVYGTESLAGARFALEEIEASGLLGGDRINLVVADDMANPGAAAQAVQRMIDVDDVVAILGGSTSAGTAAAIEVTRAAEVPQLSPLAIDPELTRHDNPWFARITQSADVFATNTAQWLHDKHKARTAYMLIRNDNWGLPLAEAFSGKAKELGIEIVGSEAFEPTAKEFKPMLSKVAEAKPDFLLLYTYYTEGGLIVKQMSEMGIDVPVFAQTSPGIPQFLEIAGPASDGTYGLLYYFAGSVQTEAGKNFVEKWQAKFKRLPSQYEGMGYDSLYVMAQAIKRAKDAGEVTRQSVRDQIYATKDFPGATGNITILPSGDSLRPLPFVRLKGAELILDDLLE